MRRIIGALLVTMSLAPPLAAQTGLVRYSEICDASGAVALDGETFLVVSDEIDRAKGEKKQNTGDTLVVYRRGTPAPIQKFPLKDFLPDASGDNDEADLEGVARIGNTLYFIGSHARSRAGKGALFAPNRHVLFSAKLEPDAGKHKITPDGDAPYRGLLADILASSDVAENLRVASTLAPDAPGGFNIEGLAATPGNGLFIGLRSPLIDGKALVLSLEQPDKVLTGAPASFGATARLDLGRRGIRALHWTGNEVLIVAGPVGEGKDPSFGTDFALFRWSGKAGEAATEIKNVAVNSLRPEAVFIFPGSKQGMLLSDDGTEQVKDKDCKNKETARPDRSFRALPFTLD